MPFNAEVALGTAASVLELALKHKIPIDHSCGGSGSCGTCRVRILKCQDHLEPMNFVEESMAKSRKFAPDERLSCQTEPVDGLEVLVPIDQVPEDRDSEI